MKRNAVAEFRAERGKHEVDHMTPAGLVPMTDAQLEEARAKLEAITIKAAKKSRSVGKAP